MSFIHSCDMEVKLRAGEFPQVTVANVIAREIKKHTEIHMSQKVYLGVVHAANFMYQPYTPKELIESKTPIKTFMGLNIKIDDELGHEKVVLK